MEGAHRVLEGMGTWVERSQLLADNLAVTAWHVVKGARRVTVRLSDREEFEATRVVDKDELRDVALLRLRASGRPVLTISDAIHAVGSRVYVVGAPEGLEFSLSDGPISQVRQGEFRTRILQFSAPASPGSSGGPLVNSGGTVVGVANAQFVEGRNLNLAVAAIYIRALDRTLPTIQWPVTETTNSRSLSASSATPELPHGVDKLKDVKSVFVGRFGADQAATLVREKTINRFASKGVLAVVTDSDKADAQLVGLVAADIYGRADTSVFRLVGRDGRILWTGNYNGPLPAQRSFLSPPPLGITAPVRGAFTRAAWSCRYCSSSSA